MPVGCDRTGVLNMVKKYANRDDDPTAAIRIKKGTVITHHRCDDVVGCRIIDSEDDANKSLKPRYWPDGMSWETDHLDVTCSNHATVGRSRDHHAICMGVIQMIDKNLNIRQRRNIVNQSKGLNGHARCVDFTDFQYSIISSDIPW